MKKFLIWTAIILLCLTGTGLILLGSHSFQQRLTQSLVERFQEKLPGLEIDSLSFSPFRHHLEIFGAALRDEEGEAVVESGRIDVSVRLLPLLKGKVNIESVRLIAPQIRLEKETADSPLNLTDWFSGNRQAHPDKNGGKKSFLRSVSVASILIKDGRLRYDQWDRPPKNGFDIHHADALIQSRLSLDYTPGGLVNLTLNDFSLQESGGLDVRHIRMESSLEDGRIRIGDFRLELTDSQIESKMLDLDLHAGPDSLRLSRPFELTAEVSPKDLSVFWATADSIDLPDIMLTLTAEGDVQTAQGNILLSSKPNDVLNLNGRWQMTDVLTHRRNLITDWKQVTLGNSLSERLNQSPLLSQALPDFVRTLGDVRFSGKISTGNLHSDIDGQLQTDWGKLLIEGDLRNDTLRSRQDLSARLSSGQLDLSSLSKALGTTAFQANLQAAQQDGRWKEAELEADFHKTGLLDYSYDAIRIKADMNASKRVKALLSVDDPNGRILLKGSGALGSHPSVELDLHSDYVDLGALKLLKNASDNQLDFHLTSILQGSDLDHLRGTLQIDSLHYTDHSEHYRLDQLRLTAEDLPGDSAKLSLLSDRAEGEILGRFRWASLLDDLRYDVLERHLPSLLALPFKEHRSDNQLSMSLQLKETEHLSAVLNLPLVLTEPTTADIRIDAPSQRYDINLSSAGGSVKSFDYERLSVDVQSNAETLQMTLAGGLPSASDEAVIVLEAMAKDDKADMEVVWNGIEISPQGELLSSIGLDRLNDRSPLRIFAVLSSPVFHVGESEWAMDRSDIRWDEGRLSLQNFSLSHDSQYIMADGTVSGNPEDSLLVRLQDFSLDDLFMILNARKQKAKNLSLGGRLSGEGNLASLLQAPRIGADLSIDGFTINQCLMGDVEAHSRWNERTRAVELNALIDPAAGTPTGQLAGEFNTQDKMLRLDIDANGLPLDFISYFTEPSLSIGGKAFGDISVKNFSATKQIEVTGDAFVSQGRIGIGPLNAKFSFDDSIHLTPNSIRFHNIAIRDAAGNSGSFNGDIHHQSFKNMRFDLNMDVRNLMIMDIPASTSSNMYGTVYATGTAALTGTDRNMQIDVNAKTEDRSSFAVSFAGNQDNAVGYEYLQFISRSALPARDSLTVRGAERPVRRRNLSQTAPTAMRMNLQLDITPQAEIALVTNPETGDGLRGRGNGRIRVVYGNRENLALYGRYELENGRYEFSMMDILRRAFNIESGSYINFYGDPMSATMDINASYAISNVPLADLLDEREIAALNLNRTSIPVNCTLNLSGELNQPGIQFGLTFPNADDELQRRILNVINTDEILNRQIVYLMLLNRFAATDLSAASATGNNNMTAVVGATLNTLSTQLNRMIYQALGTDNLSLGFNYRYDDMAAGLGEWQVAMTSQLLDNRLIINGNIGSREDLVKNNTQFIGDFDLEYKFSSSGRWRLKMFNRSNDSRYFKSAMTTQGVGVVYKESFNTLAELRRNYIERLVRQILKSKSEADFQAVPKRDK